MNSDITFIVQGPVVDKVTVEAVKSLKQYGRVILSSWSLEEVNSVDTSVDLKIYDPSWPLDSFWDHLELKNSDEAKKKAFTTGTTRKHLKQNVQNCLLQCISTLNGLNAVETPFAVKVREDQIIKNAHPIIEAVRTGKFVASTMITTKTDDCAYHLGDWMIGGRTEDLVAGFSRTFARENWPKHFPEYIKRGKFLSEHMQRKNYRFSLQDNICPAESRIWQNILEAKCGYIPPGPPEVVSAFIKENVILIDHRDIFAESDRIRKEEKHPAIIKNIGDL